ncbi:TA system antitoxin ParD family protein [Polynucleobacter duraquae]
MPFQQIEHWTRLGKLAENNSQLTGKRLLDILNAQSPGL